MKMPGSQPRVRSCPLGAPALGADNAILADTALHVTDDTEVTVFAGQPAVPRNITVKGNDANVTGDVIVEGLNAFNVPIAETIALAGAAVVAGNLAFRQVTKVTLPDYAVANTERVRVGTGAKLGLPVMLSRDTILAAFRGGAREANRPTVVVDVDEVEKNTVTLSSALNGTAVIVDLYETN
ncbi:hypothetical protein [Sphingopyxis macrogoltabida]|uniref:Uncharacterized protein n=1 Tax=Sphingopyxis macrogoltabida TaxID=33050 RepID=A0AAC8Z229_SPHMC|nr:hypothetical protein [Sphingopyxis macrogoltabida]ALJ14260.1 hypothetical protein LH19_15425 [Sphingopyxis macrogoltabida]AMU90525.1 hypothetical protein ATM17_15995 [Sphingopyxis macrogoltabida]